MKKWSTTLTLVTSTVLLVSAGCQQSPGLSEADRAAIRDVGVTYATLMNARDFKGVAALYTEDAIILPPNRSAVEGRAAIQAFLEDDGPLSNFKVQLVETDGRLDLAYAREMVTFTVHSVGAPPTPGRSKVLSIWRRTADGSWKVLRDVWNPDPVQDSSKQ